MVIDDNHTRVPVLYLYGLDGSYQQVSWAEIDFVDQNAASFLSLSRFPYNEGVDLLMFIDPLNSRR